MTRFVKDGRIYDTENSTRIGSRNCLFASGKIGEIQTLFRTQKGAFFLHVVVREPLGRELEYVEPIAPRKARYWAEKHLSTEIVCRFFEVEEA